MTAKKRALVLWSGGLDSTVLVERYLKKGWSVDALPVVFKNSYGKVDRELAARNAMVANYFGNFDFKMLNPPEISIPVIGSVPFSQVPVWITAAIMTVQLGWHHEVAMSYVMNDDAISFLKEIQALWRAHQGLFVNGGTLPPLKFPLSKVRKTNIIHEVPAAVLPHLTWCESSEIYDFCGRCGPCKRAIDLDIQHRVIDAIKCNPSVTAYRSITSVTPVDDMVLTEYPEKKIEHDE